MCVLRIQFRVRFVETFVSSDLHCRGVVVAVQRRWQLFHTRSCHLGPGQSDVGHSLGHHHPSVGHRCLFFSKLLPLGDQALSAAIMFRQPLWSVQTISPKKIFFAAQRSLLLLLASIFCGVNRPLENQRDADSEKYFSFRSNCHGLYR